MALDDVSFHDLPPAATGLVAGLVLAAVVAGAFAFGGAGGFVSTYDVSAVFTDAAGLRTGAPVQIAGVEVGSVSAIDGDFELGQVVVTMAIEEDVEVPADARADLRSGGLFGGWVVRLTGDHDGAAMATRAPDRRRIPVSRTTVAEDLVEALDTTTLAFDRLDTDAVARITDRLGELLAGTRDSVPRAIDELEGIATVLEQRAPDVASLARDVQVVADLVEDREAEIDALVDAATRLLDELTTRRDQLAELFGEGDARVRELTRFLADHGDALDALARDVHRVTEIVHGLRPEVNQALALLGPTFERLGAARGEGPWLEFVAPSFGPFSTNADNPLPGLPDLTDLADRLGRDASIDRRTGPGVVP